MALVDTNTTFTVFGPPRLEQKIGCDLEAIAAALRGSLGEKLVAVALSGGYGRGEGGSRVDVSEPRPFNDYDVVVIGRGLGPIGTRVARRRLARLGRDLTRQVGIAVDLAIVNDDELQRLPCTVLWYETRTGHRVIWGAPDALAGMPEFRAEDLPLDEGTKLLLNRGAMLLESLRKLRSAGRLAAAERESVIVSGSKAILACGDVALLAHRRYHWSYRRRPEELDRLCLAGGIPGGARLAQVYRDAVGFKLRPDCVRYPGEDLSPWLEQIIVTHARVFHWFEEKRLGRRFASWLEYGSPRLRKLPPPSGATERVKNLLRNGRLFGVPRDAETARWYLLDPGERLLSVLPLLLFAGNRSGEELATARRYLGLGRADWAAAVRTFMDVWHP